MVWSIHREPPIHREMVIYLSVREEQHLPMPCFGIGT